MEIHIPGQNRLFVLAGIFLILVLGSYFVLAAYKRGLLSSLTDINSQIITLDQSRDKKLEAYLLDINRQLSVINPLITAHFFWSDAFTKIQNATQAQVQFQSINADVASKKIVIKALAADYTTIARQIAALYAVDSITDVMLNKIQSQSAGRLEVTMQIFFDTDKFLNKKQ